MKKIISLFLVLISIISINISFANTDTNTDTNIKNTKEKNITIKQEMDNGKVKTITLTEEEIKNLEKQRGFLKILESLYNKNQKIFIGIIMDKKLQEELYADPVKLSFSDRSFFINNIKNQFAFNTFLEKTEAFNFLSDLKDGKEISIDIESSDKIIKNTIKTGNFLENKKIKYEYLFKLTKKNNKFYLKEIVTGNQDKKGNFNISTDTENYIEKDTKIVPGLLGYSSVWQIIMLGILIIVLLGTIIFGYIIRNIKRI